MDGESLDQSHSLTGHRSESKVLVGQKRGLGEVEETSDSSPKRMKMRDLESVFRSEAQAVRGGTNTAHQYTYSDSREIDLNINVSSFNCAAGDNNPACADESNNLPTSGKHNDGHTKARAFDLDLNTEDISSSLNDPFFSYKNYEQRLRRDGLECGSSVGTLGEKDSMRVWKGLKQNNYMSTLYGNVPTSVPKPRGKKKVNNNDVMKKKIELAKKEQADRFARVAAPSGLLNGLNPGIINHVRNSKQVHSIIEALVRSEKNENRVYGSKKFSQDVNSSGVNTSGLCHGDGLMGRRQTSDYGLFSKMGFANTEMARGDGDSYMRSFSRMPLQWDMGNEDDKLALKLSSSVTVASGSTSCLSNDESGNLSSVNSLSVKAANVASQWLDLLNQDIKERLAALRRSKKRVRSVITTELPLLMSREFSSNPEKDACDTKGSTFCHFDQAAANAHSVRWRSIFEQMDKALSEEESQLESWLNQVKEMQLHCDKGLYKNSLYTFPQQTGPIGNDSRSGAADKLEKDLSVRAAAASIYSTCNFLLSMENC